MVRQLRAELAAVSEERDRYDHVTWEAIQSEDLTAAPSITVDFE